MKRPTRQTGKTVRGQTASDELLSRLTTSGKRGARKLTKTQAEAVVSMFAHKRNEAALDVERLAPPGSFLRRILRHFDDTDISYALPLFQVVMLAASSLTQNGACLEIKGLGRIRPTLWTIGLAESGSAKTLASDRITSFLSDEHGNTLVEMLPAPGSDAQWIEDLAVKNGAFWFQDEAGKFFNAVLKDSRFARIKPWMLSAYSHAPISNRLKGEAHKLAIEDPHFTLFGLSVFSTWRSDIDAASMLDGFLQRMNFVVSPARSDTDMFEHFLYFAGEGIAEREADLLELWRALCAQPGAAGIYRVGPDVLDFLSAWWRGLRDSWGDGGVPASFVRRIGYSVLKYLVVLQFLLGKSRAPIDIETARLATRFAEYHLESAWIMIAAYDQDGAGQVRKVVEIRQDLRDAGQAPTVRNISRRLSKKLRGELSSATISAICDVLDGLGAAPDPFLSRDQRRRVTADRLVADLDALESRYALNARKRHERRLRDLRRTYRASVDRASRDDAADKVKAGELAAENVVALRHRGGDDTHPLSHML